MNWVDLTIISILAISVFFGLKKGFMVSLFSLFAILAGFYLASYVVTMLGHIVGNNKFLNWAVFTVLFVISAGILTFVGKFIRFLGSIVLSGFTDKLAGLVIGVVRGIILCGLLLFGLMALGFDKSDPLRKSLIAPAIMTSIKGVVVGTPNKLKDTFSDKLGEMKKAGKKLINKL